MADTDDEFAAYVGHAARLMGVDLAQADPAAVAVNVRNYRALYDIIRGFETGGEFDPAAVFRP